MNANALHPLSERMTPEAAAGKLTDFFSKEHSYDEPTKPTWSEFLSMYGGTGGMGEVRVPGDWNNLPKDREIRVVYLVDHRGPVVRWVDSHSDVVMPAIAAPRDVGVMPREEFRRLPKHEQYHLSCVHIRRGDGAAGVVREGWVVVSSTGQLSVQS